MPTKGEKIGTRMLVARLQKVALVLVALPVTCMVLCSFRVEPVHSWMMRNHCPLAMLTMHPPSHPTGVSQRPTEQHAAANMTMP